MSAFSPGAEGKDVEAGGFGFPGGGHLLEAFGMAGSEVVLFGAVGVHVVEFPGFVFLADELPFAVTEGAVAFVFPEDGFFAAKLSVAEGWDEAGAFGWLIVISDFLVIGAGEIDDGGHDVDEMGGLRFEFIAA